VIEQLRGGSPDRLPCEARVVHRSSPYHEPRPGEGRPLREALIAMAGRRPSYGYRRLTLMPQREGHTVNAKRVRRPMGELDLSGEPPLRHRRTTNGVHPFPRVPDLVESPEVTRPDQVWVSDIIYIRLKKEFICLAGKRSRPVSCPLRRNCYDRLSWTGRRSDPSQCGTPRRLRSRR